MNGSKGGGLLTSRQKRTSTIRLMANRATGGRGRKATSHGVTRAVKMSASEVVPSQTLMSFEWRGSMMNHFLAASSRRTFAMIAESSMAVTCRWEGGGEMGGGEGRARMRRGG